MERIYEIAYTILSSIMSVIQVGILAIPGLILLYRMYYPMYRYLRFLNAVCLGVFSVGLLERITPALAFLPDGVHTLVSVLLALCIGATVLHEGCAALMARSILSQRNAYILSCIGVIAYFGVYTLALISRLGMIGIILSVAMMIPPLVWIYGALYPVDVSVRVIGVLVGVIPLAATAGVFFHAQRMPTVWIAILGMSMLLVAMIIAHELYRAAYHVPFLAHGAVTGIVYALGVGAYALQCYIGWIVMITYALSIPASVELLLQHGIA